MNVNRTYLKDDGVGTHNRVAHRCEKLARQNVNRTYSKDDGVGPATGSDCRRRRKFPPVHTRIRTLVHLMPYYLRQLSGGYTNTDTATHLAIPTHAKKSDTFCHNSQMPTHLLPLSAKTTRFQ
jgi:hypothetical protein